MILEAIQRHELARELELPERAQVLCRELRNMLVRASDTGTIQMGPAEIYRCVRLLPEPPPQVVEDLHRSELRAGAFCIVGGEKNQRRDRGVEHLVRSDGAWFDFSITVREVASRLELLAYDFEIRFPAGMGMPFLRFDLNLPAHRNEEREMRSHVHLGCDDVLCPAPRMSPSEMFGETHALHRG